MKTNSITRGLSIGLLIVYLLLSLFVLPVANILVSASIGMISYGSSESIEVSCVVTILVGVMFYSYRRWSSQIEGFEANNLSVIEPSGPPYENVLGSVDKKGSVAGIANQEGPMPIVKLVKDLEKKQIKGMLSSSFVEGFADASSMNNPVPDAGSKDTKKEDSAVPSSTAPAPVKESTKVSESFKSDLPADSVASFAKEGNNAENTGLFRLGAIPTDKAGGPHIDASTTLMSALNALKPDQIKAMTDDTQKLMETQKNLMGMLSAMKPMLQDGKQMMETFGTMFNK